MVDNKVCSVAMRIIGSNTVVRGQLLLEGFFEHILQSFIYTEYIYKYNPDSQKLLQVLMVFV